MRALRYLGIAAGIILAAGLSAPYLGADYFRGRIERALKADLNREVSIGKTRFNLFTGPGFTIEEVIIEEDPRIGVEPFASVRELDARVDLISLLTGELQFSSLRLVEPSVNFARSAAGEWNVQLFLNRAEARSLPPISITDGHLHLKFGDRKAVVRLEDAEGDINQSSDGRVRLSISGEPYRSDRSEHGFGRMALRGSVVQRRMDFTFELLKTPIQDFIKIFDGREMGLKGFIESEARLVGPLDNVEVTGQLKTSELANRLFLPSGGSGSLPYQGVINFVNPSARFSSSPGSSLPVTTNVAVENFLKDPDWSADIRIQALAAPPIVEMFRQLGFALPAGMDVKGQLGGALHFGKGEEIQGDFTLDGPVVQLPNGGVIENIPLRMEVSSPGLSLKAHTSDSSGRIEAEGKYDLDSKALALTVTSHGARILEARKLFGNLPLLEQFADGAWRGSLSYRITGRDADPAWNGSVELTQGRAEIPGIADSVILSFTAAVDGAHAVVRNLKGKAGKIEFSGEYRYEPGALRPHRVNLVAAGLVNASELERLFQPTLARTSGFLARTLRFTRAAPPEWLRERQIEGTIRFTSLQTGNWIWSPASAAVRWSAATVQLTKILAQGDAGKLTGEGTIDLTGGLPVYSGEGALSEAPYRGGTLDVKGKLGSRGLGDQLLENAAAEGTFEGADIRFTADSLFDSINGSFQLGFGSAGLLRTRVAGIEATQGGESYRGKGTMQSDGRLLLDLDNGTKQIRVTGTLFGGASQF